MGHNIIMKEEITEGDSFLVYIPIIYYKYICTKRSYLKGNAQQSEKSVCLDNVNFLGWNLDKSSSHITI